MSKIHRARRATTRPSTRQVRRGLYPIEKLDVKNYVKNNAKNGVKNDLKNWDSFLRHFLRHFLRQESVVLTTDIEKVCVHVVNNGTKYLCLVPNLYSY